MRTGMNNKAILVLVVLGLFSMVSAELKIGIVNSDKIIAGYNGTKSIEDQVKKERAKLEQEATVRQKRLQEKQAELEKQSLLISEDRKKQLTEELQREYMEYQKFVQQAYNQSGQTTQKLLEPMIKKINDVLNRIAKTENYDFIFDTKGGVVYAKQTYDLSDKVIKILNSGK